MSWGEKIGPYGSAFRQSLLFIRPPHILHQWLVISLAVAAHGVLWDVSFWTLFSLWMSIFLVMPLLFILNDYLHKDEDQKMGRDRFFLSVDVGRNNVLLVVGGLFLIVLLNSLSNSVSTLFIFLGLFVVAGGYGYFKHKRRTLLTYTFRFLTGLVSYLFVASYLGFISNDLVLAVVVGWFDLKAHISGDLRDYRRDKLSGLRTFPILHGIGRTQQLILGMQVASAVFLLVFYPVFGSSPSDWELYLLVTVLITSVQLLTSAHYQLTKHSRAGEKWIHMFFHMAKLCSFLLLVTYFSGTLLMLFMVPVVMILEVMFYTIYLWSDYRL